MRGIIGCKRTDEGWGPVMSEAQVEKPKLVWLEGPGKMWIGGIPVAGYFLEISRMTDQLYWSVDGVKARDFEQKRFEELLHPPIIR